MFKCFAAVVVVVVVMSLHFHAQHKKETEKIVLMMN